MSAELDDREDGPLEVASADPATGPSRSDPPIASLRSRIARVVNDPLAWWLLPLGALVFLVARLWSQSVAQRLDFNIYFAAVQSWRPDSIYDFRDPLLGLGFTYPPFAGLILRPLTGGSALAAERIWFVVALAATVAFIMIVVRSLPVRPTWSPLVPVLVAVSLLSTPVWLTLRLGQINALLAVMVLVDAVWVGRRAAGALVGLCGAIKLTPMYAVLFFVAARRWRAVGIAVVAFVAATVAAWAWMPDDSVRYWTSELFATDRVGALDSGYSNSLRRLVALVPVVTPVQTAIWLVLAAALAVVAIRRAKVALDRSNPLAAITIVMCAGLLSSPITWSHHLYFMIPALFLLVGVADSPRRLVAAAVLTYTMIETIDPGQEPTMAGFRAVALLAIVLWLPIDEATTNHEAVSDDDAEGVLALE